MKTQNQYIVINQENIPIQIKDYANAKTIKLFFKGAELHVTKPTYVGLKPVTELIKKHEAQIYQQYQQALIQTKQKIKEWKTGESIWYQGNEYAITRIPAKDRSIHLTIEEENKKFCIEVPANLEESIIKPNIDSMVKKLFKNNTEVILTKKVPYWSQKTKIPYSSFKVRDAISKYGSCTPRTKVLHFSSRLIMLPEDVIDAITVHELCHILHPNHSAKFYEAVRTFYPDYDEKATWLKQNGNRILF